MSHILDWRAAYVATRYGRPAIIVLLLAAGALALSIISFPTGVADAGQYMNLAVFVLGFGLSRRIVAGDRLSGAWSLLFQRATSPASHYARVLILNVAAIALLFVAAGAIASVAAIATGVSALIPWLWVAAGASYAILLLAVGFGISALVRRLDMELLLMLLTLTVMQVAFQQGLHLSELESDILEWLLLPINPIILLERSILGGTWQLDAAQLTHLILYPSCWIALGFWWLRRYPYIAK